MTLFRRTVALGFSVATLVVLVLLLRQDGTGFEHLIPTGLVGGAITGSMRRGNRGLVAGAVIGAAVGAAAPIAYAPFWLGFTLPPHPEVDL